MRKITLRELLEKRTVAEIRDIASVWRVKNYSKMKKTELVEACTEALKQENVFVEFAYMMHGEAWEFYQYVLNADEDVICDDAPVECVLLESLGFIYVEECEDDCFLFIVPEEIKDVCKAVMDKGFGELKERSDLIHNYAQAAVNLYGIIPQEELMQIFNAQNEEKTDIDEMFEVFLRHIGLTADYCLWEEYIVHNDFEEDDFVGVEHLAKRIIGKPRYIPEKYEFLRYSDCDYYEINEQYTALNRFLVDKLGVSIFELDNILDDVHYSIVSELPPGDTINLFYAYGIMPDEKQLKELIRLTVEISNNTRLWSNNGHTPVEIGDLYRNNRHKSQKVGRNEPCPCGSGKKYKRCCGMK